MLSKLTKTLQLRDFAICVIAFQVIEYRLLLTLVFNHLSFLIIYLLGTELKW